MVGRQTSKGNVLLNNSDEANRYKNSRLICYVIPNAVAV